MIIDTDARGGARPHISVCICTFKRAELLSQLLSALESQRTDGRFTYEIVVADNDVGESARQATQAFAASVSLPVTYCVEAEPNIARARNLALASARGDLVAFIDDDECPGDEWLFRMYGTLIEHEATAVLGPVVPDFQNVPPDWVKKGRFFDRPTYPTGRRMPWFETRTGNVLVRHQAARDLDPPFRTEFATAGEDVDFFRRLAERGGTFVWCHEAAVREHVPAWRCTRRYLLRRAALRGSNFPKQRARRVRNVAKSIVALPLYIAALPVLAIAGHHYFIAYLIKILDHGARLLAFAGLPIVTERET